MKVVKCFKCGEIVPWESTSAWGKNRVCTNWLREYRRNQMAELRKRNRPDGWTPRHPNRHAQLQCDGKQHMCTGCAQVKSVVLFPRNAETPCGFDPRCSQCRHDRRVERRKENHNDILTKENTSWRVTKYGITYETYLRLYESQNGLCFLCEQPEVHIDARNGKAKSLAVDHDHRCCPEVGRSCGRCIRGLLCWSCNQMLGHVELKPKLVEKFNLFDYINRRALEML